MDEPIKMTAAMPKTDSNAPVNTVSAVEPAKNKAFEIAIDLAKAVGQGTVSTLSTIGYATMAVYAASAAIGINDDRRLAEASRGLTPNEAAHLEAIFGPDFDTTDMRIYYHREEPRHRQRPDEGLQPAGYVLRGNQRDLHMVGMEHHARDYTRSREANSEWMYHVFIHEATHTWQHAQPNYEELSVDCDIYDYTLTADTSFGDLCNEQQAEVIAAYAIRFFYPNRFSSMAFASMGLTSQEMADSLSEDERQLARVVEEAFPHAAQARWRVQAQFDNAARCIRGHVVSMSNQASLRQAWAACATRYITHLDGTPNTFVLMDQPAMPREEPILSAEPHRHLIASIRYTLSGPRS